MERNLTSEGTSTLADGAIQRIASKMQDVQTKRANKHVQQPTQTPIKNMVKTASKLEKTAEIKVASINDIPNDFEKMGTGFYRQGHHLWELTPQADGGFMLTRKHGEDHVLGYDPEPVVREAAVRDRHGKSIKVGSKVTLPHRGTVTAGTVIIVQPGAMGVELDSGEKVDTPPDICELLQEMVQTPNMLEPKQEVDNHEENREEDQGSEEIEGSDTEACVSSGQEFEPMVEPTSKTDMPKEVSKEASMKEWQEYWHGMGQHVAQASSPKQTKEEAAMKRKQRRQQRSVERSGLPKGMKVPPKHPKSGAIDTDELAKLKERNRLYQQCFDEIEYVLQDESLKTDEVRLADEMDRVMQEYHDQIESMDEQTEESREDELSIEEPVSEPVSTEPTAPLPKISKIVMSMSEL